VKVKSNPPFDIVRPSINWFGASVIVRMIVSAIEQLQKNRVRNIILIGRSMQIGYTIPGYDLAFNRKISLNELFLFVA
jgi:hypothetical protein